MSEDRAIQEWQKLFDAKQTVLKYRNALAGDGGGTVNVAGEPGYIWCRYSADQSKVSKIFNIIAPGLPEDFPLVVGRRFPTDEFEQVLAVNWTLYQNIITQATVDGFTTGNHGESHNAASGNDPAPIDLRNIVEMRGRAQATPDLTVFVERGQYIFGYDDVKRFPGGNVNLAASVPGVAGHRFVLVYVDGVTNAAASTAGLIVPLAAACPIPDLTANTIPVCLVELENGQTTITEDDIYDWRFLWDLVSWNAPWLIGTNAERLALAIGDLAELTHFAETDSADVDQIWQVWEGAWRLVYPPSVLSASDGDPGNPWTTNATGQLTGSQPLELNDGAGNSPALRFVGGSNNDTISVSLIDDAVANDSDIRWILAGQDGDSEFQIYNNDGNLAFKVDDDGNVTEKNLVTQQIADAVTNTYTDFQIHEHETSGSAAAGFGIRHLWKLEDAGGALEDAGALTIEWENAGAAAEATLFRFWLRKAGVALGPFIEFGATEVVFNESSADIDFRIESDGLDPIFFINAGTNRVGINTSTPAGLFAVVSNSSANNIFYFSASAGSSEWIIRETAGNIAYWRGFDTGGTETINVNPGVAAVSYFNCLRTGFGVAAPDARIEIETTATEGRQAMTIDQNDANEAFIDFQGSSGAGTSFNLNTTERNTFQSMVMVELNGTQYWLKAYQ